MWAKTENSVIVKYGVLPQGYQSETGYWNDFDTRGSSVHESEGFFLLVNPKINHRIQEYGDLFFDGRKYTYPVNMKTLVLAGVQTLRRSDIDLIVFDLKEAVDLYLSRLTHTKQGTPAGVQAELDNFYAEVEKWETVIDNSTDATACMEIVFDTTTADNLILKLAAYR